MIKYVHLLLSMAVLRASAQTAELVYPDYHNGAVVGMEYSQNKQWLLTGGADGRAMLWNAKNKTLIKQFRGHYDALTGVSFALSDSKVVTASFDGKLIVWEANTGMQKRVFPAMSGEFESGSKWKRNPLFPPFTLDSARTKMVFYAPRNQENALTGQQNLDLCFYSLEKDTILWKMPVVDCDKEHRPFSFSKNGDWLLFTDYQSNKATGDLEPFVRLVYTADTALQYRWWGSEGVFNGNEAIVSNGYNLLHFNPQYETSAVKNLSGGYGFIKHFAGNNLMLMESLQDKEASNVLVRNFNLKYPFRSPADSVLFYLSGSREMKLPYWRVTSIKTGKSQTVSIKGDSGNAWKPLYRLNETLAQNGLMAFHKQFENIAFWNANTGESVVVNFFKGKADIKSVLPLQGSDNSLLVSLEHASANQHEFAIYLLQLDYNKGTYNISEYLGSDILNRSLSVEDDNNIVPDLLLFPDGNRVMASDKMGGIRLVDYQAIEIKEKAVVFPGKTPVLGPAAVNDDGSKIRCYSDFNNIFTFSSKSGQPASSKKSENWRLLPDQTLFNKQMLCVDADSIWQAEYKKGIIAVKSLKTGEEAIFSTGPVAFADLQVVNNKFLHAMGNDGGLRVFSMSGGALLFTQYIYKDGSNIIFTPNKQYDANELALTSGKLYAVKNLNLIPVKETSWVRVPGLRKQLLR